MSIRKITVCHVPNVLWHYRIPTYNELALRCEKLEVQYIEVEKDLKSPPRIAWNKGVVGGFKIKGYSLFVNYATLKALRSNCDCLLLEWNLRNLSLIPISIIARHCQKKRVIWWGHGESKRPNLFTKLSLLLGKLIPHAVVVYMNDSRNQLISQQGYAEENTYVARNGVDVKSIIKASDDLGGVRHNVTWVTAYSGRLVEGRDLERIIYTVAELTGKGIACKHYFIGDGDHRLYLEKLANTLKVNDKIIFCGAIHHVSSLAKVYAEVDFVIIPGWLGLVINQAFAFAKPVIICDKPELHNPEIALFDKDKGWSYSYDGSDLVDVYLKVVNLGKSEVAEIGRHCQKLIVNEYSTQNMVDGLQYAIEGGSSEN